MTVFRSPYAWGNPYHILTCWPSLFNPKFHVVSELEYFHILHSNQAVRRHRMAKSVDHFPGVLKGRDSIIILCYQTLKVRLDSNL